MDHLLTVPTEVLQWLAATCMFSDTDVGWTVHPILARQQFSNMYLLKL